MSALFARFIHLHQLDEPLLLPNIWDAASLLLAQQQGAKAVATSSAALAWSLGYADGDILPIDELLAAVSRLMRVSKVPLSIDLEQGYGHDPLQVAKLVKKIADAGIAGINLEDGADHPERLADKIRACRQVLSGQPLFINARTDVYLRQLCTLDTAVAECVSRFQLYQHAGADGAFIPGLTDLTTVTQLHKKLALPVNLMGWPAEATLNGLAAAGVKRLSAGPALCLQTYSHYQQVCSQFLHNQDLVIPPLDYANFNTLF